MTTTAVHVRFETLQTRQGLRAQEGKAISEESGYRNHLAMPAPKDA
jgi:hypothetical protein